MKYLIFHGYINTFPAPSFLMSLQTSPHLILSDLRIRIQTLPIYTFEVVTLDVASSLTRMHFNTAVLVLSSTLLSSVLASCKIADRHCKWYGESPICGETEYGLTDWDGDEQCMLDPLQKDSFVLVKISSNHTIVVEWTRYEDARELQGKNWISMSCLEDYGLGCATGYKRLWCSEFLTDLSAPSFGRVAW